MGHRELWLFVRSNGTSRMKRNRVPHQLDLVCRNARFFQKRARRVRTIDLETLLCGVAVGQSRFEINSVRATPDFFLPAPLYIENAPPQV